MDGMSWTAAIPAFLVTLREGFEAALAIAIVVACLNKAGRSHLNRWVFAGIGAGIAASAGVGAILMGALAALDRSDQLIALWGRETLQAVLGLVAIALLSTMLIWMTRQARQLKGEMTAAVTQAVGQGAAWGVFALVLVTVLREGFETAIFLASQFQVGVMPLLGAIAGVCGAVLLGLGLTRWGLRLDVGLFFRGMGVALLVIVSGLTVSALKHIDGALLLAGQLWGPPWSTLCGDATCLLGPQVWDASGWLSDRTFPGIVLKTLVGYRDRLFLTQLLTYLGFWVLMGTLYWQSWQPEQPTRNPAASSD
jgi:high-affinity iron transporter